MDTVNGNAVILRGGTYEVEGKPEMRFVEVEIVAANQALNIIETFTRRMQLLPHVHSVRRKRLT